MTLANTRGPTPSLTPGGPVLLRPAAEIPRQPSAHGPVGQPQRPRISGSITLDVRVPTRAAPTDPVLLQPIESTEFR